MSMHDGHRQRLRNRFLRDGLDNFEEVNALELLLFHCIPRQDTNPVAHRLLERFGSYDAVLDASRSELLSVEGIGENTATFLSLMKPSWRYYNTAKNKKEIPLTTISACGYYLLPFFSCRDVETVYLLCLDAKSKVIACRLIGEGNVNSASISIRKIVETAMSCNATSVVLAHNHPSGVAIPSVEDIETTKRLGKALNAVEIILVDHLVIADNEFVSIAQSGAYSYRDCEEV